MIFSTSLFFVILAFGIADSDADENSIFIENNIFKKYDYSNNNYVKIDGVLVTPFANMTVTFPNGYVMHSSVEITRSDSFTSFVYLQDDFESGVYTVTITPYDDSLTYDDLVDYFLLTNSDSFVDITIGKNAAQKCMYVIDNYGNENGNICVTPQITHIPKSFGIHFINMDSKTHKMDFGIAETDLILPESDAVIFLDAEGTYDYSCIFHPWIKGVVSISEIPSLTYVVSTISNYTDNVDLGNDIDLIIPQENAELYQYDTSCSNCYVGTVTKIVDGDTIHVNDKIIRLSLVDTPESRNEGFEKATSYTAKTCPVGMSVLVDIDDLRPQDKYKRSMAKITCEDVNLNAALLSSGNAEIYDYFCTKSEFIIEEWAADGCGIEMDDKVMPEILIEDIPIYNNTIQIENSTTKHVEKSNFEVSFDLILIIIIVVFIIIVVIVFFMKKSKPNFNANHDSDENFVLLE